MSTRRRSLVAPRALPCLALLVAVLLAAWAAPAADAAPQLVQVASGLTSPIYATTARDGSNRIFIVEQGGVIKVLRPGAPAPTVFLDITTRVLSGGERGLLGLAFHPQFTVNRRFFVNYTRQTDGATVVAEYQVSASDPDVASPTERVILTVAQPFANHNGGMIEFGPDGMLYIGLGDGGSANDPGNRAQNVDELLGKILRIAVTAPGTTPAYTSPGSNPLVGVAGRDEIWVLGLRNPWRFSFDRATGQLWAGDVGQGAREEVDIITRGANYGWRILEGTACTGLDPTQCSAPGFTPPVTEYDHSGGRCSITGGYVYRGPGGALPGGTYVFADYCSGEIFTFAGGVASLLLDTTLNVSSFGEDEQGEILVVALGGAVYRLTHTQTCAFSVAPVSRSFPAGGGADSFSVSTAAGCGWTANSNAGWIQVTAGSPGSGGGTVSYTVAANTSTSARTGAITAGGQTHTVTQAGAAPPSCTFRLSTTRITVGANGGPGSIAVTAAAGCAWTAASDDSWITITSGPGSSGNGTVTYSVAPNSTSRQRNGSMTITGQTVSVRQKR